MILWFRIHHLIFILIHKHVILRSTSQQCRIIVPPELGYPENDFNRLGPKPTTFSVSKLLSCIPEISVLFYPSTCLCVLPPTSANCDNILSRLYKHVQMSLVLVSQWRKFDHLQMLFCILISRHADC